MQKIIVTGSEGLVGTALCEALEAAGHETVHYDLALGNDVLAARGIAEAMRGCTGIVHLAAISRVIWGERDPQLCWRTNVTGTECVLQAALAQPRRPWMLFASSREVYGDAAQLPVRETAPMQAVNIYGRAKIRGEELMLEARAEGLRTAIVRLSNVYGSTSDHVDRVIPAFTRAAAMGGIMRVDGLDHTFDFTHVDDSVAGIVEITKQLETGEAKLPPIHLLTGVPTTLSGLAMLAIAAGSKGARVVEAPPRNFDVAKFVGDPGRAQALLGWTAKVGIAEGVTRMVADFARELAAPSPSPSRPSSVTSNGPVPERMLSL